MLSDTKHPKVGERRGRVFRDDAATQLDMTWHDEPLWSIRLGLRQERTDHSLPVRRVKRQLRVLDRTIDVDNRDDATLSRECCGMKQSV